MSKIYEGESKLSILQVCDKLRNEITAEQANVLVVRGDGASNIINSKERFAHMVLDAYKHLPSTTDHDMMIKKLCKHLMEKYMKSTAVTEGEDSAYRLLLADIEKKANSVQ